VAFSKHSHSIQKNWRIDNPIVGPPEMTFDLTKCRKLLNAITHSVIWANQMIVFSWIRAHVMLNITCIPAFLSEHWTLFQAFCQYVNCRSPWNYTVQSLSTQCYCLEGNAVEIILNMFKDIATAWLETTAWCGVFLSTASALWVLLRVHAMWTLCKNRSCGRHLQQVFLWWM